MVESPARTDIAYFSMEVGLDSRIPTYGGGLGVLAGDLLRSAADLGAPMVGVTLLHRRGYFRQHLDAAGNQSESSVLWDPEEHLERMSATVTVEVEGRSVRVGAFRTILRGVTGGTVPVYFLDTDLPENHRWDRSLTDHLYRADPRYRLGQEVILGLGGVAMLAALGLGGEVIYHMNEGHSALLVLALLEGRKAHTGSSHLTEEDIRWARQRCVFTTHTPVPAGHDLLPRDLVERVLGPERTEALERVGGFVDDTLNMTRLALRCSRYINGVSLRHRQVSSGMFPDSQIHAITNGVHAVTWTSPSFQDLFDRRIAGWRQNNLHLRYAQDLPLVEVQEAHTRAKRELLEEIQRRAGVRLDPSALTIGFARRAAPYKRSDLLFADPPRLKGIARRLGPLQVVFGGKAHPADEAGKDVIRRVIRAGQELGGVLPVVYLENYDMELARLVCAGVDLWLNTPLKPLEASGTSGMKAAMNGVPSLSVLDGWWMEGHIEGVTGWSILGEPGPKGGPAAESASLYEKLEDVILPLFFGHPTGYARVMRSAIAFNGSYFNTQRMLGQYLSNVYFPVEELGDPSTPVRPVAEGLEA